MIKFIVQLTERDYNYKIIQMDVVDVIKNSQVYYTADRTSYDMHHQMNKSKGYYSNRIWKVPSQFRGRNTTIDSKYVFDTREDAAAGALKLVEEKLRNDIVSTQKQIADLEKRVSQLSGMNLAPQGKFSNCSTVDLKKGKRS